MYRTLWACSWIVFLTELPVNAVPPVKPGLTEALALEETMQEVIRKTEPSIVCILVTRSEQPHRIDLADPNQVPESYGSGVVVDEKGLILTNRHVVTGATRIFVRLPGGRGSFAEIHADDPRSDLAVIRLLDPKVLPVPAIKLGDGAAVKKGQFVLSLANPFAAGFRDGSPSASWGILSNIRRRVPGVTDKEARDKPLHHTGTLLQTDARLNLGCSGGVLIDLKGEMIGLTTSIAAIVGGETPGGFALPIDAGLRRIIDVLKRGEEVEYGFLGVEFDVTYRGKGVRLHKVWAGSPAYHGGLRDHDVIQKVNGIEIRDTDDLFLIIGTHLAGTTIQLETRSQGGIVRQGVPVTLAKFLVSNKLGTATVTKKPPILGGLRVDYTSILVQRDVALLFGGNNIPSGVVIREVQTNSAAEREKLQPDKVITHVNGKEVKTPGDFYREMERAASPVEITLLTSDGRPDKVKIDIR